MWKKLKVREQQKLPQNFAKWLGEPMVSKSAVIADFAFNGIL